MLFAKLIDPLAGYPCDQEKAKMLNPQTLYEVDGIMMGQSHTSVLLKDFAGVFNSVQFQFVDENGDEVDIYRNRKYNPYI